MLEICRLLRILALIIIIVFAAAQFLSANVQSSERVFYISTSGNDSWSGALPDPVAQDGPFATIQHARDVIRELKSKGDRGSFIVLVRGGMYRLDGTLTFAPEDSGAEDYPIIYKAYENEKPILTGAKLVSTFQPYKGKLVRADLKGTALENSTFRQLFVGSTRQILARFPNLGPKDPIGSEFLYVEAAVDGGSKLKFKYAQGAVENWAYQGTGEIFIYPGPNYWNNIIPIAGIDKAARTITLTKPASYPIVTGNRYYIQNVLEALDAPGEWFFDKQEKALYFWPADKDSLKQVSVPVMRTILEFKGDGKDSPSYIRFEGFTFEGCEGSAIVVKGGKHITIAGSRITNAGGNGIEIQGGFQNSAIGNEIFEVGGAGIVLSGGDRNSLSPSSHRADSNHVHHTGVFEKWTSGINCMGVGNIVSHNLIHDTPRIGIWFDGNDHVIEYNHVHHVNRETQDSGIIYSCARDWTKRGNVVRFNYLHDSGGYGRNSEKEPWQSPFYTWGIYLDDWTSGTTVYGNIVERTYYGGLSIHGGRDNIIENNIFVEGMREQIRFQAIPTNAPEIPEMIRKLNMSPFRKYPEMHPVIDPDKDALMSGNKFRHNIVYSRDRNPVLYTILGQIDIPSTIIEENIIYQGGKSPVIPFTKEVPDRQWDAWKMSGMDRNSLVADSLFRDYYRGDYRLLPESPAWKLGFKPIPIEKIGPLSPSRNNAE